MTDYADVLATVMKRGLREGFDLDDLDIAIGHEARAGRGLNDSQVAEAIAYAREQIRFRRMFPLLERHVTVHAGSIIVRLDTWSKSRQC